MCVFVAQLLAAPNCSVGSIGLVWLLLKLEIFQTSFQQSLQFKVNLKETCAISNSAYSQSDKILF